MHKLQITDSVVVTAAKEFADKKERIAFLDNVVNHKETLVTYVKATHAARITRNNGLYLPVKMKKGMLSLFSRDAGGTAAYNKPVLVNHDTSKDPVGRVVGANYNDLSKVFKYSKDTVLSRNLAIAIDKLVNTDKRWVAVDTIDELIKSGLLMDRNFQGLGYIKAKLAITDATAAEKVLDDRYMTVSTRMSTDTAICSVCKSDWATDGLCDHKPGEMVDGVPCFLIAGEMEYDEISWATIPADTEAVKESVEFVRMDNDLSVKVTARDTVPSFWSFNDSLTEVVNEGEVSFEDLMKVEPKTADALALGLVKGELTYQDAFDGETLYELNALISLHDRLHYEFDWIFQSVKYMDEAAASTEVERLIEKLPKDTFKVHAKLHDLLSEKGQRGAMMNGELDKYDSSGSETGEYLLEKEMIDMKLNDLLTKVDSVSLEELEAFHKSIADAIEAKKQPVLTIEDYKALVSEKDQRVEWLTNEAKELNARLDQKKETEDALKQDLVNLYVALDTKLFNKEDKTEELAIEMAGKEVKEILDSLIALQAKLSSVTINIAETNGGAVVDQAEPVGDPTLAGETAKTVTLDKFGTTVVSRYKQLVADGEAAGAKKYLSDMKNLGIVSKDFDITPFLN